MCQRRGSETIRSETDLSKIVHPIHELFELVFLSNQIRLHLLPPRMQLDGKRILLCLGEQRTGILKVLERQESAMTLSVRSCLVTDRSKPCPLEFAGPQAALTFGVNEEDTVLEAPQKLCQFRADKIDGTLITGGEHSRM